MDRIASGLEKQLWLERLGSLPTMEIEWRHWCEAELIATGAFSPLTGFMAREEVIAVAEGMCLPDGTIWSIPIILPCRDPDKISEGASLCLTFKGKPVAVMEVEQIFEINTEKYCKAIYSTTDEKHPGVARILKDGNRYVGGKIWLLSRLALPSSIHKYYLTPKQTRALFASRGLRRIAAFQTRNPIHRAHEYLIRCAMEIMDAVLIHPIVGETKEDDIPADVRLDCYTALIGNYLNPEKALLSVLPATMHYAGPREAIHHMIMRKNFGCTHMLIGRDHAGVGNYYGTYDAQKLATELAPRLGIEPLCFENAFYCGKCDAMVTSRTCPHPPSHHLQLSGTQVRAMLREGKQPPPTFTRPEVAEILIKWATSKQTAET